MKETQRSATRPISGEKISVRRRGPVAVILTCALVVIVEGYDQSVYGSVLPALVDDASWNLSHAVAGYIGSAPFLGMLFGALGASAASVRFSRRSVLLSCLTVFGVFGTACAAAGGAVSLGVLRLLTGVGLGGVLPLTTTLTLAMAPPRRRMLIYAVMFTTVPVGGLIAALIAKPVIPAYGPMVMFLFPLPLAVAGAVACWLFLPVTPVPAREGAYERRSNRGQLFGATYRWVTLLLIAATLLGLLLWYGLTTWLPGVMSAAGYNIGSSLTFQALLLGGGAIGSVALAPFFDSANRTSRVVTMIYLLGAVALIIAIASPAKEALWILIFVAGAVAQGGLITLNGVVDSSYPQELRATALGATLGFGRVGAIIAPSVIGNIVGRNAAGSFTLFAAVSVAAGIFVFVGGRLASRHLSPDPPM